MSKKTVGRSSAWMDEIYEQFDAGRPASRRGAAALSALIRDALRGTESPRTCWFHVLEALECVRDLRRSISPKSLDRMFAIVERRRTAVLEAQDEFLDRIPATRSLTEEEFRGLEHLEPSEGA